MTSLFPLLLVVALFTAGKAHTLGQVPCVPKSESFATRSCGPSLCFASAFNHNGVLQQAPARPAYYGATGQPPIPNTAIQLRLSGTLGTGEAFDKVFTTLSQADGTWRVVVDPLPMGGNLSAALSCAACPPPGSPGTTTTLFNQTLGEVWVMSGQSNMGQGSPVLHNTWRNASYAGVLAGNYTNIVLYQDQGGTVAWPMAPGNYVTGPANPTLKLTPDILSSDLDAAAATSTFFAMKLTDLYRELGLPPPPIQIYNNAVGGTNLGQWASYESQLECLGEKPACLCYDNFAQYCNVSVPLSNRTYCSCNGMLWGSQTQPLLNLTIKGLIYWQGEADTSFNARGYTCQLGHMISAYRAAWSAGGTTPSDFPFGVVLLADGTDGGAPYNLGNMILAQSRAAALSQPPAFLVNAFDVGDPWMDYADGSQCQREGCCVVDQGQALGVNCSGDHRGQWDNRTNMDFGGEHPRTKDLVAARMAQAVYASVYAAAATAPPGTPLLLATGPVAQGCTITGTQLTLHFDAQALKGERLQVVKPPGYTLSTHLENTALYVLVNATLPSNAGLLEPCCSDRDCYNGPYSVGWQWPAKTALEPGTEFCTKGWVAALPTVGSAPNEILVDLSALSSGEIASISAVRYSLGGGGNGYFGRNKLGQDTDAGRLCCGLYMDTNLEPCPPESCPIKATGRLAMPAMPFVFRVVDGSCTSL